MNRIFLFLLAMPLLLLAPSAYAQSPLQEFRDKMMAELKKQDMKVLAELSNGKSSKRFKNNNREVNVLILHEGGYDFSCNPKVTFSHVSGKTEYQYNLDGRSSESGLVRIYGGKVGMSAIGKNCVFTVSMGSCQQKWVAILLRKD